MNEQQRETFEKHHDADLSYGTPDGVRYRVNVFRQRGQTGMVLRIIPPEVPGFDKLNLPPVGAASCARRSAGSSWSPASPARASRRRWRR